MENELKVLNDQCEQMNKKHGSSLYVEFIDGWFRLYQKDPIRFELCKTRKANSLYVRLFQLEEDINNG